MMHDNPVEFKRLVQERFYFDPIYSNRFKQFLFKLFICLCSFRRQYRAIDWLASHGMIFWDYGNAFLLEVSRAFDDIGQSLNKNQDSLSKTRFKYPSYMVTEKWIQINQAVMRLIDRDNFFSIARRDGRYILAWIRTFPVSLIIYSYI